MLLLVFFGVGALLAIGPWCIAELALSAKLLLSGAGLLVLLAVSVTTVVTRLYRKAAANMAFVRTGAGGTRVIKDGGTLVVPVMHQIIPVSLETMRLNVERRGPHALITRDNLRVDLSAEFYIKVQANAEDILQAARSLGGRNVRPAEVSELVQEKLVSALRTVAATKDLHELHSKRDEFASSVQEIVTHDLASNGLTLESVTISSLDQTDPGQLQSENVFDAQGLRKIAEITQRARVERNEIERDSERAVVEKDVATRKQVLAMQREQSEFEAEQHMQVSNVQAAKEREVMEFRLAQEEAVARRSIEKQKSVEMTEVDRRLATEQAEIVKAQAIQVAERAKEVAVAQKERERAAAQAAMLDAEAQREAAKQRVLTVQVSSEAEREAQKKLVAAKQGIAENKIREETEADVLAYMEVKKAEAERQAADLQCEARLRLAEGEAQANVRRSDGERTLKMVDVDVERQRVGVEQARVDVERQSLANKQEFHDAGLKFELDKLRIEAEREIRIQTAQALGQMLANAHVQIFGDPTTMARMTEQFMRAASYGTAAEGLMSTLPANAKGALGELGLNLARQFSDKLAESSEHRANGDENLAAAGASQS